jgi:hypothetical protein
VNSEEEEEEEEEAQGAQARYATRTRIFRTKNESGKKKKKKKNRQNGVVGPVFFSCFFGYVRRHGGGVVYATNSYRWVLRAWTFVRENPTVDILETSHSFFFFSLWKMMVLFPAGNGVSSE